MTNIPDQVGVWTPGPWQNGCDDLEGIVSVGPLEAVGDGNVVCLPPDSRMEASFARWPDNARLIIAAKELFEALEKAERILDSLGYETDYARAALNKALGK